jgi:O-phospho-L-seryl-tRNASec:L-selenocysteinyl-tRNA synthase
MVVVQSTDKNFMVPVGGAIITSPDSSVVDQIAANYPGRASAAPIIDLFITLLSMGESGYKHLLQEREKSYAALRSGLERFATKYQQYLLPSPKNSISIGCSLMFTHKIRRDHTSLETSLSSPVITTNGAVTTDISDLNQSDIIKTNTNDEKNGFKDDDDVERKLLENITFFGSMLFQRNVSGCRVVAQSNKVTSINGYNFRNWGSHHDNYPSSYFTAASAIGITDNDVEVFINKLESCVIKFLKMKSFKFKHNKA